MNPDESPTAAFEKVPIKLPWTKLLLLVLGLLLLAAIMTPALIDLMDAIRSGSSNISHDVNEVAPKSGDRESK